MMLLMEHTRESLPVGVAPYLWPQTVSQPIHDVYEVWKTLKVMRTDMPLVDDFGFHYLGQAADRAFLIDVSEKATRFQFEKVGWRVSHMCSDAVSGRYLEALSAYSPLHNIVAQCMTTVGSHSPTYYRHPSAPSYERILLPLWGESRVEQLLGATSDPEC